MKKQGEFALYKGDRYLYGGTKEDLAKYLNTSMNQIHHLATPWYYKNMVEKKNNNCYYIIKVEDYDREDN